MCNFSLFLKIEMKNDNNARVTSISIIAYDHGSVVPNAKGVKINEKKNKLFESFKDILIMNLMRNNNHHNYNNNHFF